MKSAAKKSSGKPQGKALGAAGFRFSIWHVAFLLLGMALVALAHPVASKFRWQERLVSDVGGSQPATATSRREQVKRASNLWGDLEYVKFSLEEPDEYLPDSTRPLETPKWFFENYSERQLVDLFRSLGLQDAIKTQVLDTAKWERAANGIYITPSPELKLALNSPARQQVYAILARSPVNVAHCYPFRFRAGGFEEWFGNSGLATDKQEQLRKLTYSSGGSLCLVDIDLVQKMFSPQEFKCVFQSLYSEPSLLMRLRIGPDSDVDALVKYWGRGGRARKITPMLRSLAKIPEGTTLNVSYLLPPFARLRLYTFSSPSSDLSVEKQDCFWSALNFFNDKPDARLSDKDFALEQLKRAYVETKSPRIYGDLILLLDAAGATLHACVYIADDVVFTKNGVDYLQPWVLMKIPDVLAHYQSDKPVHVITLRPKSI